MPQLAISKDYMPAYAALPRKAQRKADEFLRKFREDPTAAAIHLEPVRSAVDKQLRSARIGDDYRLILRAPERGEVFLILYADHHDEAYAWASTKQTEIHPATGSLQIYDVTKAIQSVTTTPVDPREPPLRDSSPELPRGLFSERDDDELFMAGVPRALLPSVRAVATEDDLDRLLPHLPPEAGEVLTALAAGISLDEALEEVLGRTRAPAAAPPSPPVDVADVHAALARETTQRQFRLLEGELDLDEALKNPLDVWRVFLHPKQRKLVRAQTKGPTRVLGGAGTGKTVVALHRAAFLVREVYTKPDDRVLFTTFNVNLAADLRSQLGKLLAPDDLARVEVANIDSWATTYLRRRGVSVRPAFENDQKKHLDAAVEVYGVDGISTDFYRAEWRDVIQEQGLVSEDDYVRATRLARGVPLGRAERRRLWPVFAAYRQNLEHAGMLEPVDVLRRVRELLAASTEPPRYRSVVVDEVQDFSAAALGLVRAIAGAEHPDDLFLVGDAHQRIYGKPVALSKCGIHVRGRRSQTLRLNYRTTGAICRFSLGVLDDAEVDDLDEGKADRRGYISVREGPRPEVRAVPAKLDEEAAVVALVKEHIDTGTPPEAICVVARTRGPLADRFEPALQRAQIDAVILDQDEPRAPGVRLATMHRVKGLEFAVVVLTGASKDELPLSTPELRSSDPMQRAQALLKERCLLYVAASRARDELYVVHTGQVTELLGRTAAQAEPKRATAAASTAPAVAPPTSASLDTRIESVADLPTRMRNYAERNDLVTLGDLARLDPAQLLGERNLGRKSIADTRTILEGIAGAKWETLSSGAAGSPDAPKHLRWDAWREALTPAQRETNLAAIDLPSRMRTFVEREKMAKVGDLAERAVATLPLGPRSVEDSQRAIEAYFASSEPAEWNPEHELIDQLTRAVERLDPMMRIIATRRCGLGGESLTLAELGEMFGISRERVRQLEARLADRMSHEPWGVRARLELARALVAGAVPLRALEATRWWSGASGQTSAVRFVVENVLDESAHVVEIGEEPWLVPATGVDLPALWSTIRARAEAVPLPAAVSVFDAIVGDVAGGLGPAVGSYLREALHALLRTDESPERIVLAFGDTNVAELIAVLRASPEPMHVDEAMSRVGGRINRLPDEVIHFRRGTIGLKQHFPDFEAWRERLVPAAVELVTRLGPERQWTTGEILDELRESYDIPDWLTAYGLAALVRSDGRLRYLGRLRVALPESVGNESRIFVHDQVEELLVAAGEPMARSDLLAKLGERLGATEIAILSALNRPQFVRVDETRMGLLSRDVPGGSKAALEAADLIDTILARRERGLSEAHVVEEVRRLSAVHASWSVPLAISVLRADGRFRFNQSGAVGLATWESTRVPTKLELVRSALVEAGGRVTVEAVLDRIEAHYGSRPQRASLANLAVRLDASLDGEWMTLRTTPGATSS